MALNIDRHLIFEAYKNSNQRILFFDYDGTLVPFCDLPEQSTLKDDTRQILVTLLADKKNRIYIISGRQRKFLSDQFFGLRIGLVAEHGLLVKEVNGDWINTSSADTAWKVTVKIIFSELEYLFPGSFIEEKESSIAYHYRTLKQQVARKIKPVVREKFIHIQHQLPDLELLEGNNVVEIKPKNYNKGTAASGILGLRKFDFILAAGDDCTDEQLFDVISPEAFTIKIGNSPTHARYRIHRQEDFIEFLKELLKL